MCGIAGCWRFGGLEEVDVSSGEAMAGAIAHRGPDDMGRWEDTAAGLMLLHRRLSIIDLSPQGHQPMVSATGRYVIVFNGEVYNFPLLRAELESLGHLFRGHSDTEVLLAAIEQWGVQSALIRANAMLAFALWDRRERTLTLARDRFGEKPLYYGISKGALLFGSELKALRAHPSFSDEIDRRAVAAFLRFGYVPAPRSIYSSVSKVEPGALVRFDREGRVTVERYWSLGEEVLRGKREPFRGSNREAVDELERLVLAAVNARMVSDVPLGAFLSGGIDSSTIVSLMQSQASARVKTFTIGFRESSFDEATAARQVAQHLGTEHTELYVTPEDARAVIPDIPYLYDEPFADSSQIPTYLVSALARRAVTVAISGDGGDELFGGYSRYRLAAKLWRSIRLLPQPSRAALARGLRHLPVFGRGKLHRTLERSRRWGDLLSASNSKEFYRTLAGTWREGDRVLTTDVGVDEPLSFDHDALSSFEEWMMYADSLSYLPDDILVKVDRACMGVGLEGRIPLLDPNIARFAWSLPLAMRVGPTGKGPLKEVLGRHLPQRLFERPKMGFGVPIREWLRGPLRDLAEELLRERTLQSDGFFDPTVVRRRWTEHLAGVHDWQYAIWYVLVFQMWLRSR